MRTVAAALILQDNQILLARRAPGQKHAGYWEFPGGKQEPGETLQHCLEREMREEFLIECKAGDIFQRSIYHYAEGCIELVGIWTQLLSHQFTLTVHDQIDWIPLSELLKYNLTPADIPIAEQLHHYRAN